MKKLWIWLLGILGALVGAVLASKLKPKKGSSANDKIKKVDEKVSASAAKSDSDVMLDGGNFIPPEL